MSELIGIVRFTFHEGQAEQFKRLSAQCMEIVRTREPGTLQYDTFLNGDESAAVVVERFRDSAALIEHGTNMAGLMESIMATGSIEGELLGHPNEELRALLTGEQPILYRPFMSK